MSLPLLVAVRFRKGRRRSGMLSLISIISTLSIAIGIAALIVGLSAMNGFERELRERVLSVVPHGEIYSPYGPLNEWQTVQAQLKADPQIVNSAPYVSFTALIENGSQLKALQVKGVDLAQEAKMSALPHYVQNQRWRAFAPAQQQIIIGIGLAQSLGVKEDSWVTLLIPNTDGSGQLKPPKRIRLQVVGILQLSGNLGNSFALLPLADSQSYLGIGDGVTGIMLNVTDIFSANRIIGQIRLDVPIPLRLTSWETQYGYMYHDIQMIRQIMYLAMVVVIGVACFNIVSTLVIAVKDKQRDIAILKTLGADNQLIRRIFIWYGLISGLIGSLIGVLLGVLVAAQLSTIIQGIEVVIGHKLLNSNIYFVDFLPSEIHSGDIVIVFITAMLLSLLASYYPANRACKIDPVKILNGI